MSPPFSQTSVARSGVFSLKPALLVAGLTLSACAQPEPVSVLPIQPVDPVVTPVEFSELRGPDPQFAVQRISTYLRQCRSGAGERVLFDPNGLRLVDATGTPRLSVMIAHRGPVTGVALDGPDFTPIYQEELAQAIEGRSTCA